MKLSTRARYALRLSLELARAGDGVTLSLGEIARRTDISRRYLDQLAFALKGAGLLSARPGRGGGYMLARPAQTIRLGDVVEASLGPVNVVDCAEQPLTCTKADHCECRVIYRLINQSITRILGAYSLEDLASPGALERLNLALEGGESSAPGGPSRPLALDAAR